MGASAAVKVQPALMPGLAVRWAMAVGGVLWGFFGYYRFLSPYGRDVLWREDLGYSLVLSNGLFVLYNLPGVLALLMTTWAALLFVKTLHPGHKKLGHASILLLMAAGVFGLMAAAGQLGQLDALTTGGLSFGTLFLGLALIMAGLAVAGGKHPPGWQSSRMGPGLILLGGIGVLTLLLRPLMYALQLLPLAFGAAAAILFGLGWILLARVPASVRGVNPLNPERGKIMFQGLMCKLNLRHEWHVEHTEDGSLYKRCLHCGKDDDRGGGGTGAPGTWAGPAGMG